VAESLLWMLAKRSGDVPGIRTGKGYIGEMPRVMEAGKRMVKLRERKLKVVRVK